MLYFELEKGINISNLTFQTCNYKTLHHKKKKKKKKESQYLSDIKTELLVRTIT